ncbi:hypothetical protein [Solimonas terrae]|uniref:Pyridoxamine 5'-phosphate oxidase putative domain-containing protein n=1 Tax=Solimonas terrae TaxID=1396819 RepID=A0A6M2BV07_9GAMM|nr:hypothetical protein [Solimonas terrae]NGY05777.1 hypothetical protein [Solimonas terrae]
MGEAAVTLSAAQAAFIEGPRSIYATSCDARFRPSLARLLGCIVADDRRQLILLAHPLQADRLLHDVEQSGVLAVVFNAPETHQTLQLKGTGRRLAAPPADAEALVQRHLDAFVAALGPRGFTPELVHAVIRGSPEPAVAIGFRPQTLFEQTPGPQAGQRIAGNAP